MMDTEATPTLLIFADDWGRHPSSCQHLAGRLLGRYEILWVNTIGMRPPRLDLATLTRGIEKIRHWNTRGREPEDRPAGLRVVNPRMWPWFRSATDRAINRTLLTKALTRWIDALSSPPVAITTIPIVADLVGSLAVDRWVYYCVDDFGQWPGLDQRPLQEMESLLVERADTLIAASESLQERLAGMGRSSHLLTHGVDLDHWCAESREPLPELAGLEHPLVVFWGVVDRRMDVSFVRRLSEEMSRGTIVIVGPESDPDPALRALSRVVCTGPIAYERLPMLAREAAVLVMPYGDLPVTQVMQPLKLKEYLATGRPVVVRDLPATRPWADCLDLADTPECFSQAVRQRLSSGLPACQASARERLAAEGWAEKARIFEHLAIEPATVSDVA
jgi:glycosyltransferase involved in cell wall biosynthesis